MSGYALHGEQTRKCQVHGAWNGLQPICQPLGGGLTCLGCKDMSHLYLCDTVTACSNGQVCYVETYKTNGGQVKYNSGCVDSHQCVGWKQQRSKRSAECVHCCSSQLCNANGCGSQGLPSPDLRGPLCYDCSYVSNMEECKTVKLCAQDEVCSIEKYDWGGVYDHYTAKCHSMQCISHKRSFNQYVSSARTSRSTPVCQNCCSSDLCNTNCNVTSQGGAGVAIVG
ncbi:uncharacterized protein LOC123536829 isoform X1 [Mercenaria mercenaria]|uniref:uncharacterized protein LOC123536829 isoform X1 n=1 Tax=Mercenaria mercenaria TaxID=6596 RepID=UPI00234F7234|nr:uncharacterized protein LOC123536829 isoform X1 [Mercenaria mercenaria]